MKNFAHDGDSRHSWRCRQAERLSKNYSGSAARGPRIGFFHVRGKAESL